MSKTLIIIRHGKAEDGFEKRDFDRSLNAKGIRQAEVNGSKLRERALKIDMLMHSSANRTSETSNIILDHIRDENIRVFSNPNLYLCPSLKILDELVAAAKDTDNCVMIVGHNNGLSDFYNQIVSNTFYYNLSTCEMAVISFNIVLWSDLYQDCSTTLLSIENPNN